MGAIEIYLPLPLVSSFKFKFSNQCKRYVFQKQTTKPAAAIDADVDVHLPGAAESDPSAGCRRRCSRAGADVGRGRRTRQDT